MRKILSFMLAAVMLSALIVPAQAAADGIKVADVTVQEAETVYIPVLLQSEITAAAVGLTYSYDPAVLEIIPEKCSWSQKGTLSDFSNTSHEAVWAVDGTANLSGDLCVLAFRVLNMQSFRETEVSCHVTVKKGAETIGVYEDSAKVVKACAHNFGDWTDHGDSGHIRKCSLCKKEELQSHEWDQGTKSADPERPDIIIITYQCKICKAQKISEVPGDGTDDPDVTRPTDPEETKPEPSYPNEEEYIPTRPSSHNSLWMNQEYVILKAGETVQLSAQAWSDELTNSIRWSTEKGDESVVTVDENGLVTAKNVGTDYVIASVTDGDTTLKARCRIDVAETEEPNGEGDGVTGEEIVPVVKVEDLQLSTTKLTTELYSTDYAVFEILLQLPQNVPEISTYSRSGVTMGNAEFLDPAAAELFDLLVLDDRRIAVVPKQVALDNPGSVKSSYSSTIAVTVSGLEEPVVTEEKLTLTVKQTKPKLTAKIDTFNSFYTGQSQEIQISGGTVTGISLNEAKKNPDWLTLEENCLVLNGKAPAKSTSAKVYLNVETEEWTIPAPVKLSATNTYKQPGLRFSASSVTLVNNTESSRGASLKLQCTNSKDTLAALNVAGIAVSDKDKAYYSVSPVDLETGTFLLTAEEGFKAGKISLEVSFSDTDSVMTLPLTVKTAAVTLKRDKSSITLNRALEDSAVIAITATPADYTLELTDDNIRLADSKGKSLTDDSILDVTVNNNQITVATNSNTPAKGTYRICVSADGSKEIYTTITVVNKTPTVSFKAKGTLDLSFPENEVTITPSFKNYVGGTYEVDSWTVVEKKGKKVVNEDVTDFFDLNEDTMTLTWKEESFADLTSGNTYEVTLKLKLPGVADPVSNKVSLTMKRTSVKLKLGASSVSLNKLLGDTADISVSCATNGYAFEAPILELWDSKGKTKLESGTELADNNKLYVTWENGKIHMELCEEAKYGESFQIKLKANAYSSTYTIRVTIPTEAKSTVTVSLKAAGSIDVIRSSTQIVLTPTYKNCMAGKDWVETLWVYTSESKYKTAIPAKELFDVREENGTYILTAKEGLNPKLRYKVQLESTLEGLKDPVKSAQTSISVKMGSAKVTMTANGTTLFAKDKNDRAELIFTAKDETLNQVERIEIKDSKYRNMFEIIEYGNGEFAIGFANGIVDSSIQGKTITLNLNVFLEGNKATAATTMKLKLTVVK